MFCCLTHLVSFHQARGDQHCSALLSVSIMSSSVFNINSDCDCCTIERCNLGVSNLEKICDKDLKEILKEESGEGNRQKVANNLKLQNDRILRYAFSLGEGFEKSNDRRFTFNNLAMDKLRKDNDRTSDLGKL